MSKFQEFCYVILQRDIANKKRRRLLGYANAKLCIHKSSRYHGHKIAEEPEIARTRIAYRSHAEAMKKIAAEVYTPMRKELGIKCNYDGNNAVTSLKYDGEIYYWRNIVEHGNAHIFDSIVLDGKSVDNPYSELIG